MAHTYDTKLRFTGAGAPLTSAYTCGAGTSVLVLGIVVAGSTNRAGGAPTYNGIAMTQSGTVQKAATTPETNCEMWYLLRPPTGASHTISIPNTGAATLMASASTYKAGTNKTSIFDVAGGGNATSTNPSASVTTTGAGAVIVASVGTGAQTWAPSARSGTQLSDTDVAAYGDGHQYFLQTSAGAQAMSWTFATSEDWAITIASFKEQDLTSGPSASTQTAQTTAATGTSILTITGTSTPSQAAQTHAATGTHTAPGGGASVTDDFNYTASTNLTAIPYWTVEDGVFVMMSGNKITANNTGSEVACAYYEPPGFTCAADHEVVVDLESTAAVGGNAQGAAVAIQSDGHCYHAYSDSGQAYLGEGLGGGAGGRNWIPYSHGVDPLNGCKLKLKVEGTGAARRVTASFYNGSSWTTPSNWNNVDPSVAIWDVHDGGKGGISGYGSAALASITSVTITNLGGGGPSPVTGTSASTQTAQTTVMMGLETGPLVAATQDFDGYTPGTDLATLSGWTVQEGSFITVTGGKVRGNTYYWVSCASYEPTSFATAADHSVECRVDQDVSFSIPSFHGVAAAIQSDGRCYHLYVNNGGVVYLGYGIGDGTGDSYVNDTVPTPVTNLGLRLTVTGTGTGRRVTAEIHTGAGWYSPAGWANKDFGVGRRLDGGKAGLSCFYQNENNGWVTTLTVTGDTGGGPSPITGTSASSQVAQTHVAVGTETFTGVSGVSLNAHTHAATGAETISGTSTRTQTAQVTATTGLETFAGTSAVTQLAQTSTSAGLETITGTSASSQLANLHAASAPSIIPTTNLQVWLKPSDLVGSDGSAVTSIPDSGPAGHNATPLGASNPILKTAVLNGHNVLQFSGAASERLGGTISVTTPNVTAFLVMKMDSDTGTYGRGLSIAFNNSTDDGTGSGNGSLAVRYFGTQGIMNYRTGSDVAHDSIPSYASHFLLVSRFNGTTGYIQVNAQTEQAGAAYPWTFDAHVYSIGGNPNGATGFKGQIAEVIVYDAALTGPQIADIRTYLATKFAIDISGPTTGTSGVTQLPNTHTASGSVSAPPVTGTSASTQTAQTTATTGAETITGTSTRTQTAQTHAASGLETITGTSTRTQTAQTHAATGVETITGTSTRTQTAQTHAATGTETITGTSARTQTAQTHAATGLSVQAITGTSASTQAPNIHFAGPPGAAGGTSASIQTDSIHAATGTETISGTSAQTQTKATHAATAAETITGTSPILQRAATTVGAGLETITGNSAASQAPATTVTTAKVFGGTSASIQAPAISSASGLIRLTGTSASIQAPNTTSVDGVVSVADYYGPIDWVMLPQTHQAVGISMLDIVGTSHAMIMDQEQDGYGHAVSNLEAWDDSAALPSLEVDDELEALDDSGVITDEILRR